MPSAENSPPPLRPITGCPATCRFHGAWASAGTAAALCRGIEETIERIDPAVLHGGIVAIVAADARHGIAGTDGIARRGDAGDHHGTLRPEGDQADVALQVVGHQPARHADGRRRAENVNIDLARALGVAEEVSAGEHEGLAAGPGVDDRAAAARVALRIFHAEPNAGGQHGRVADRRLLRWRSYRRPGRRARSVRR